ncbi:MAG: nucleoside-triphosphatase [Planctomycetota bacterium]|jgi:nucleoside-triphosphatase
MAGARVLLLTGRPGVGKTTLLLRVAAVHTACGFLTDEIRRHGRRVGFRLVPLDGSGRTVMAHVDFGGPRVGRYGVDVAAVDAVVERTLRPGRDLYLVDEIGKMECLSETFVLRMRALLDTEARLVATIALRGGGFIASVKRRPDAELSEVTTDNRDRLVDEVGAWISR